MDDWWNDDSIEVGDRITAMQNEIRRLREENHDLCNRLSDMIRPKGKSWFTLDEEGNPVMRQL